VVRTTASQAEQGHFTASLQATLAIDQPGWLALRIPMDAGRNEFDKALFAHTSPIYVEIAGRRIFKPEIARQMVSEVEGNMGKITAQAVFADDAERDSVLDVHRAGVRALQKRLDENR
jgi:hypothetical protein